MQGTAPSARDLEIFQDREMVFEFIKYIFTVMSIEITKKKDKKKMCSNQELEQLKNLRELDEFGDEKKKKLEQTN